MSSINTTKCLPFLCSAIDPRYSNLAFLTKQQKEIAQNEVLEQAELMKPDVELSQLTEGKEPPPKRKQKATAMDVFLLGTSSESELPISTMKEEVKCFFDEPPIDYNSDPLKWWKENEKRFPKLSSLAKTLLCIPATSVPSERIFSIAGNIVTKKICSLNPENVDMLIFMNKNLPPV